MWILPSRGRPEGLARFFFCYEMTFGNSPGIVYLDEDDQKLEEYKKIPLPDGWKVQIGKRLSLGALTNKAYEENPNEPWYGLVADDLCPITFHWDKVLIETADNDGIAYGNDGINGDKLCTHPVLGGDLIRELGFIAVPGLDRIFIDTALMQIGKKRGVLRYVPEVITDHWHFSVGKTPFDDTYRKEHTSRDKEIYEEWLKTLA